MELLSDFSDQIEWVEGDVLDIHFLDEVMEGVDEIYHCAAVVSFDPKREKNMMKVNVEGTANVVNIALDHDIKKLLHVSSIAAIGRSSENITLNEQSQWKRGGSNTQYGVSKFQAENEVRRAIAEGLNAVIVNPSIILGAGDWEQQNTPKFVSLAWRKFPFYTKGMSGFVDVRDVASIMIKLMASTFENERFIISAENWFYRDIFNELADNLEKTRPGIRAGKILSGLAWRFDAIRSFFSQREPTVTRDATRFANKVFRYDNSKVIESINCDFIPIKNTLKDMCETFLKNDRRIAMLP